MLKKEGQLIYGLDLETYYLFLSVIWSNNVLSQHIIKIDHLFIFFCTIFYLVVAENIHYFKIDFAEYFSQKKKRADVWPSGSDTEQLNQRPECTENISMYASPLHKASIRLI